jgi:uncharacterized protein with PQ loop repeat
MVIFFVTAYGVGAASAGLLQVRRLLESRRSCEVSALFLAIYAGGYAVWLAYGESIDNLPLVVVDGIGLVCATLTLGVALSLRGSLLRPITWGQCASSNGHRGPQTHGPRADRPPRARHMSGRTTKKKSSGIASQPM